VVQSLALIGMIAALVSLGRSFGIAPADRGLVRSGLYHYVRHPLYATELLFNAGYLIANLSWRNLIAFVLFAVIQGVRLSREERIISGYAPYASRVRWRLVPLVW
jgi:protein-S-isoprenylcysteine O-methyltransferase Ste14